MPLGRTGRFLFILYCLEAGSFLLLAPWTSTWMRAITAPPLQGLDAWLWQPWIRASISAFGIVHWIWAVHDVWFWWHPQAFDRARAEEEGSPLRSVSRGNLQ